MGPSAKNDIDRYVHDHVYVHQPKPVNRLTLVDKRGFYAVVEALSLKSNVTNLITGGNYHHFCANFYLDGWWIRDGCSIVGYDRRRRIEENEPYKRFDRRLIDQ